MQRLWIMFVKLCENYFLKNDATHWQRQSKLRESLITGWKRLASRQQLAFLHRRLKACHHPKTKDPSTRQIQPLHEIAAGSAQAATSFLTEPKCLRPSLLAAAVTVTLSASSDAPVQPRTTHAELELGPDAPVAIGRAVVGQQTSVTVRCLPSSQRHGSTVVAIFKPDRQ